MGIANVARNKVDLFPNIRGCFIKPSLRIERVVKYERPNVRLVIYERLR
jgi:hypothetical protein